MSESYALTLRPTILLIGGLGPVRTQLVRRAITADGSDMYVTTAEDLLQQLKSRRPDYAVFCGLGLAGLMFHTDQALRACPTRATISRMLLAHRKDGQLVASPHGRWHHEEIRTISWLLDGLPIRDPRSQQH